MTNLPIVLVTKENINQFSKDDDARKYILGKIECGQTIIASNCTLGEYVCSCTLGEYNQFQRIDEATRLRVLTNETTDHPEIVLDEHLEYLDELRESGVTNMFGARPYLEAEFGISPKEASVVLSYWMKTFSSRHPEETGE